MTYLCAKKSGSSPDRRHKYDEAYKAEVRRPASERRSTQAAARPRQLGLSLKLLYRWQQAQVVVKVGSVEVVCGPEVQALRTANKRLMQLNRKKGRHTLARAVFHSKKGELCQRYREGMEDKLGALGLVLNAVVLWDTRYLQQALEHWQEKMNLCTQKTWPATRPHCASTLTCLGATISPCPKLSRPGNCGSGAPSSWEASLNEAAYR